MEVEAVIWDWGGVCCTGGEHFWNPRMLTTAKLTPDEMSLRCRDLEKALYRGQLDERTFWREALDRFQLTGFSIEELRASYYKSYEVYDDVLQIVKSLRPVVTTTLLSNMGEDMSGRIRTYHGAANLFDTIVFSHEVGMAKPDPEIYELMLALLRLPAPKILFIDDAQHNIDAAKSFGMNTLHFTGRDTLSEKLRCFGLHVPRHHQSVN